MPKKFVGENSKAAAARARKSAVKDEERTRQEKAKEDAYWADDDKHVQRKQQRKVCTNCDWAPNCYNLGRRRAKEAGGGSEETRVQAASREGDERALGVEGEAAADKGHAGRDQCKKSGRGEEKTRGGTPAGAGEQKGIADRNDPILN